MSIFTPWPWITDRQYPPYTRDNDFPCYTVSIPDQELGDSIHHEAIEIWSTNYHANACLIAAAPDMYETLEAALCLIESDCESGRRALSKSNWYTITRGDAWTACYNAALEDAAKAVAQHDKTGREWIPDSLWDDLTRECAARIRALKNQNE